MTVILAADDGGTLLSDVELDEGTLLSDAEVDEVTKNIESFQGGHQGKGYS
jgi:hypothetical protein